MTNTNTDLQDRRGLEGTGIVVWGEEHTECMALRAAELGDTDTERLCDEVLAGVLPAEILANLVEHHEYHAALVRGGNLGWQARGPS